MILNARDTPTETGLISPAAMPPDPTSDAASPSVPCPTPSPALPSLLRVPRLLPPPCAAASLLCRRCIHEGGGRVIDWLTDLCRSDLGVGSFARVSKTRHWRGVRDPADELALASLRRPRLLSPTPPAAAASSLAVGAFRRSNPLQIDELWRCRHAPAPSSSRSYNARIGRVTLGVPLQAPHSC